ncbi:MAG: adenylosuccinate lyase [Nitrososphaeraceae archaeon]
MAILPIDSGRYGSNAIRVIFEEERRLQYQLEFEAEVARAQGNLGIIPLKSSKEIYKIAKSGKIKLNRVKELEVISDHDTAAVVEALSEYCPSSAKPWVHYGLTSNDVIDTCISLQLKDAFEIINPKIIGLTNLILGHAKRFKEFPSVGRTHGQHTSIISFGLKFAVWASELCKHIERFYEGKKRFLVCKTLGVVGTGSIMGSKALRVQRLVAMSLHLYPVDAATQVIARERIAESMFIFALMASTLEKIATEIRNLQRTEIGEVAEAFKKGQMGSSAVPIKRNPIKSERVCSLARLMRSFSGIAMENITLWHERDLTNSANERFIVPMSVILLDEMLNSMLSVVQNLSINTKKIKENIEKTRGQIYAEFMLYALVKKQIPRIDAYRKIQEVAFWATENNVNFYDAVKRDNYLRKYLNERELKYIFNPENHLSSSVTIINGVASNAQVAFKKTQKNYQH